LRPDEVFFADYVRGAKVHGVAEGLREEFAQAEVVVVLLSDRHFEPESLCYLEWNEAMRRKETSNDNSWDVTKASCTKRPRELDPDTIATRSPRRISQDVFHKLGSKGQTVAQGDLRNQILTNYQVAPTAPAACCVTMAGTLTRAYGKAVRRLEVARALREVQDNAFSFNSVVKAHRVSALSKLAVATSNLLRIFVSKRDAEWERNDCFMQSVPVQRLEIFLKHHASGSSDHQTIDSLCDLFTDIAEMERSRSIPSNRPEPHVEPVRSQMDVFGDRVKWLQQTASSVASELCRIKDLPPLELGISPDYYSHAMSDYIKRVAESHRLTRLRPS